MLSNRFGLLLKGLDFKPLFMEFRLIFKGLACKYMWVPADKFFVNSLKMKSIYSAFI